MLSFVLLSVSMVICAQPITQKYMATIQMAVHETPMQLDRSQGRLIDEFTTTVSLWSDLRSQHYQVRRTGNEVIISFVSDQDIRVPVEGALREMIQKVNGKVPVHGRSFFHRAAFSPESGPYILTEIDKKDPQNIKIASIRARGGRIGDILAEINVQIRKFGYFIRRECADRTVDWKIGGLGQPPKDLDTVLDHLKVDLSDEGLDFKKSEDGTYVFNCRHPHKLSSLNPPDLLQTSFGEMPGVLVHPTVYIPLPSME